MAFNAGSPERLSCSAMLSVLCLPGGVDAGVWHHVVPVHDAGEHVLEERQQPGGARPQRQDQGDEQLLGERARAPGGGVVEGRGVPTRAHQVHA